MRGWDVFSVTSRLRVGARVCADMCECKCTFRYVARTHTHTHTTHTHTCTHAHAHAHMRIYSVHIDPPHLGRVHEVHRVHKVVRLVKHHHGVG